MTRPCNRAGHSFSIPVNAPKSGRNRPGGGAGFALAGRVVRCPRCFDTLAVAQQLAAALDLQRVVKGPAGLLVHAPGKHERDE